MLAGAGVGFKEARADQTKTWYQPIMKPLTIRLSHVRGCRPLGKALRGNRDHGLETMSDTNLNRSHWHKYIHLLPALNFELRYFSIQTFPI